MEAGSKRPGMQRRRLGWRGSSCLAACTILVCGTAAGAVAAPSDLPSLVAPSVSAQTRLPGKMVFAALLTPDLVAAERFYTDLFGWQFQNAYLGSQLYGQATFEGRVVAAVVQAPLRDGQQRPAWRTFLSVDNVDTATQDAVAHGASVLLPPHPIANLGRDALLRDPQGAVFGLLSSGTSDPADTLALPGAWIWSSLVTTDPATDADFYKAVLGYTVYNPTDSSDARHLTLESQGFARAGIAPIPTDHPVSHPRWISFVRVADMGASVGKATALGGQVIVAPHQDQHGGTIALLADPAGALFGLLEWPVDADGSASAGDAK